MLLFVGGAVGLYSPEIVRGLPSNGDRKRIAEEDGIRDGTLTSDVAFEVDAPVKYEEYCEAAAAAAEAGASLPTSASLLEERCVWWCERA